MGLELFHLQVQNKDFLKLSLQFDTAGLFST